MKRAVRPIRDLGHVSMLDRIEMDVVHVPLQIPIVADGVLPITALPDSAFATCRLACCAGHLSRETARKSAFDQAPAQGKIRVAIWQRPDGV
jgi:hypothetical protein